METLVILSIFLSIILLRTNNAGAQPPPPEFKCATKHTCQSLVGYTPTNSTTLSNIQSLFQVKTLDALLGSNNLPPSTTKNYTVSANTTIKIPVPCICSNGTGLSNQVPVYQVVANDGLFVIANDKFGGLVTYQQIQQVNHVVDANMILVGQKLWIPLPCSCDDVDGSPVLHYAHVVAQGSSVGSIAVEFGTTSETLMSVNGITDDPKKLIAGQVLDVPLRVCNSNVSSKSPDYPLLVANNSYFYTANDCVKCKCDLTNSLGLNCDATGLNSTKWATCPKAQCSKGLSLGNTTQISNCLDSTCVYTGFNNQAILTDLVENNFCPAPPSGGGTAGGPKSNKSSKINLRGWNLAFGLLCIHLIMMPKKFM